MRVNVQVRVVVQAGSIMVGSMNVDISEVEG